MRFLNIQNSTGTVNEKVCINQKDHQFTHVLSPTRKAFESRPSSTTTRHIQLVVMRSETFKCHFTSGSLSRRPRSCILKSLIQFKRNQHCSSSCTFDENSSPFLRFLDYSYWPVRDLELVLRDAANVHTGKKNARLFKSESDGP